MNNNYKSPNLGKLTEFVNEILSFFGSNQLSKLATNSSRKHLYQLMLAMVFLMGSVGVKAQVANYSFAASSGSYTALTGGTSWQNGTAISTNGVSGAITLPWAFTYNSKSYTSIYISNNGFIAFANQAANAPAAGNITPISTSTNSNTASNSYDGAIAGFGMDLVASTVGGSAPDISYGTSGGDFVIQYTDLARTGQAATERITFQIRLTQTTNVITLVYNTPTVSSGTTFPEVGLKGASYFDWKNLSGTAATTWTAPTVTNSVGAASSSLTMRFTTAGTATSPVAGQTYTFTPFAALAAPTYATLPFTETFETWVNGYSTADLPNLANCRTWPSYGDRSVRKNDVTSGAGNGWTTATNGTVTASSPASGGVARFHNYYVGGQANSFMDFYVDFSSLAGAKTLLFDLYGTSSNTVYISVSTDGGNTFGTATTYTTSGTWTTNSLALGSLTSTTGVIRIENRGNWASTSDVGIDNFKILGPCVAPTSLAASASAGTPTLTTIPGSFTAAAAAPTGYLVVRTTTNVQPVPVSGTTYTTGSNAIGFIEYVNTAAGSWTSTGLTPNTTYYYWVFSNNNTSCGGGPVYSATATTFSASTSACAIFNATISINGAAAVPGVSYPNIGAAVTDLVTCGITQPTVLEIASGYTTEASYPVVLGAVPGANATNTLTIRPASGVTGKTITSANTTATIDINGGKYWIIDGRPGGSGVLASTNLTIDNTSSATGGVAIRFINDATNNTVQYSNLKAAYGSTTSGVVNIMGGTTNVTGNDNNTITLNNVNGSGTVYNGIYASGTTNTNNNVTVSNNNIYDFFNGGSATNGILVSSNNTDWTITGNRIFQTAARTYTSGSIHNGINVNNSSGNNFDISSNQIGGVSALTGGPTPIATYTFSGAVGNRFRGISISAGTTVASSIQGNTITGINLATSSGAAANGGIFCGVFVNGGNINVGNISGNTIGSTTGTTNITITTSTGSGVSSGIWVDAGTTHVISNNTIGSISALGSAVTVSTGFNGIRIATSTTCTVNNNTIGSASGASLVANTGSTNTTAGVLGGINNTSSATISITNNTIGNLNNAFVPSSAVTSNLVFGIQSNSGTNTITGNTIRNLSTAALATGTTSSASVIGILETTSTAPLIISGNTIFSLSNTNATNPANLVTGLYNNGPTSGTNVIAKNLIHSLTSPSTAAIINGIHVNGGTTTYQNNMVSLGNGLTTSAQINGINEAAGTDNFYHNSVYIGGSAVVSGTVNTFAFNSAVTGNTRSFRNNIFFNGRSNTSGTGAHFAIQVGGAAANPTGLTTNNNILFANGTGGAIGRFNNATQTAIANWRTASGQDAASFESNPQFSDAANNDLHINPSVVTFAEANGVDVGVTDDFDSQTRSGLTPVDIGADAGNFTGQDVAAPIITYTALSNTTIGTNQTLTATITDSGSGVPTAGAGLPVLYYKVNSGAYTAVTATSIGSNQYTFTFGAAATTPNDVVSYYVVAQDLAATPNISVFPSAGASGFSVNPPAVSTPPTTPSSYIALSSFAGVKTVCPSGCDYNSLTNANGVFATINSSIVSGNIELQITGDLTAETGANALNAFASPYTLKLYPTGSARVISGSLASAALIKLNGADRVTIDGSIGGTGTDRSLTFVNTATTAPTTIALISLGTGAGATNNTIKNNNISTGIATSLGYGIAVGGSTPGNTGADNDTVTIQNNSISVAPIGIYAKGAAAVSTDGLDALNITGNIVDYNGTLAGINIQLGNALNSVVNNNTLSIETSGAFAPVGLSLETGFVSSTVNANRITKALATLTTGYGGRGITIGTGNASSNLTLSNNIVYGVNGSNWTAFTNSSSMGIGIGVLGNATTFGTMTGGVNLYYNSVNLYGNHSFTSATVTAALYVGTNTSALDIRNNIFANSLINTTTSGSKDYAVYSAVANTAFTNINNNDYYGNPSGNSSFLVGFLGSDQATLAAWKTATGKDAASINQNPQFISNTDLHINTTITSYLEGAAAVIAGITTDFDGDSRNGSTPDIGADEGNFIAPVTNDFAATAFIDPVNAGSKVVGVAFTPQASFTNTGVAAQTNVTVRYRIVDAGLVEVYNQTATIASLASLATTTVSFPSATVTASGSYTIYAKAELTGDTVSSNDQINGTLTITDPYTSSTVTQNSNNVLAGATTQQVIGLQVVTSASTGTLTSLTFNTNGTTNVADISNAKIYYTGTSSTFTTTTQYGSTVAVPNGSHTVTGSQALPNGTSYFWLTYDIAAAATTNNVADAEITNIVVNGVIRTPSTTAPAGSRIIVSPMSGTYLIGASQVFPNFTSITAANSDLNVRGVSGAVIFELQSDYAATETFPISMGTVAGVSAINTVTIKPGTGVTKTISGSNSTALFNLNGAKYVTIDGSNTISGITKDLTISNTNTSGTVITFINEASNNTIKNTVLNGVSTSTSNGVILLSTTTGTDGNDNNTIQNNNISGGATATAVGVNNLGSTTTTATKNSGNIINNNNIFNFSSVGIREGGGTVGTTYSNNNIYEVATQTTSLTGALFRTATLEGFTFTGNKIYDLKTTSTGSVYGIDLANLLSGTKGIITNNMISLNATSPLTVYGIWDETATPSGKLYDIFHNTISISGTVTGASNSAAYYYAAATTADFRNNILSNTRNGGTGKHFAFRSIASVTTLTSDYNDLYVGGGTGSILANNTTADQTTLATWQTATGKDAASVNILPVFTSATDLHISPASIGLDNLGTLIATVTTDIDGETRSLTTPDLGADEFTIPACVTAVAGTATGSTQFCTSGTPTITASGYSTGSGTTYQWYSSNVAANYPNSGTPIAGQINPATLTAGAITSTTYYWLHVTCGTDSSSADSNMITITINTPATLSASAAQPTICTGGSGTTLTATNGVTYSWTSNPAGFTSTSATPSVNPTSTTVYTVNGTDINGCTANPATVTVTVNLTPSAVSVSSSASQVCSNSAITLVATGGSINMIDQVILNESFTSGIGTFTSTANSSTTSQNWTARANGYVYDDGFSFYTFSGSVGGFMLANSDVGGSSSATTNTQLISPAFNTTGGYGNLRLQFREYLENSTDIAAAIEISDDNFTTSTSLRNDLTTDIGSLSTFATTTISIPAQFQNKSNLKIRFRYEGSYDWYWAVDEVKILGDLVISPPMVWTSTAGTLYTSLTPTEVAYVNGAHATTVYAKPSSPETSVTYTASATNNGCPSTGSSVVNITPLPSFTVAPITICKGTSGTLTAVSSGSNSYSWTPVGGGATLSGNPRSVNPTVTTVYNVTATSNDTTPSCQNTQQVTVTVNDPGTIDSATATRTVSPGQETTFEVTTTGTVTYQWQVNDNVNGWVNIDASNPDYSGENTSILTVTNITLAFDTYQYRCVVTGLAPCTSLLSTPGVLNVTNTGFSTQPADVNLCSATTTSFTIVTTGDEPYNVQWQISTDGGENFTDIVDGPDGITGLTFSGANEFTPKTLFVSGITAAHNGYLFKCQLDFFLDSSTAMLTVNSPVTFAQNLSTTPVNLCKVANTTNLAIETQGSVGSVVWRYATSATGPWNNLGSLPAGTTYNATNPSTNHYNLAVMTTATTPAGSYFYKAFIIGSGSGPDKCPDVESNAANIVINSPTVVATPSTSTYCSPGTGVTLTASGAVSYSWSPSTGLDVTTGATVVATPGSNTTYTVTGTDGFGCTNTATATVNIGASFTATATNNTALSCPGSSISLTGLAALNAPVPTNMAIGGYTFENTTGTYNTIVGGPGTTAVTLSGTDTAISAAQTLPFTFNFGNNNFTGFKLNANGWMTFDTSSTNTTNYSSLSGSVNNVIAALSMDLDSNNTTSTTYYVQTVGSSPNRITKIEWANIKNFFTTSNPATGNVQIWLYEGTNVVEIRYGSFTTSSGRTSSTTCQVGLRGASTAAANVKSISNTGSWATPTAGSSSSSTVALGTFDNPLLPDNGRVYRFSPLGNGSTTFTYAWTSTPAGFTSSAQNPTVTPSVATTYNLNVTSPAGCTASASVLVNVQTATPTITVQPTATTTTCQGASASFSVTATSTTAMTYQWRRNGVNLANGTGISGATTSTLSLTGLTLASAGNYDVVVSTCTTLSSTSNIAVLNVNPLPTATIAGATVLCQNATAPTITFTGAAGTAPYTFTYKLNGGSNQTIATTSGNSVTLTVPTTTAGTFVYSLVSVQDSSSTTCSQTQTGTATVTVNAVPTAPVLSSAPVCVGSTLNLNATTTPYSVPILTQDFEAGIGSWTTTNNTTTTGTGNVALAAWTERSNGYVYSTDTFSGNQGAKFYMSNSDAAGSSSSVNTTMISPTLNTTGYSSLTLTFKHYYRHITAAGAFVDVSTDGGTNWTNVQSYGATTGTAAAFATGTVNLNTYIGNSNLKVRFRLQGGWYYYWAVDDIVISGNASNYTYAWTGPNSFSSTVQNPTIANATAAANGTYTLEITNINGCKASNTVTATVNPKPTATIAGTVTVCRNSTAPSVTFTGANGTAPYTFTYKLNNSANQTVTSTGNVATLTVPTTTSGTFAYTLVSVQDSSSTACSQTQAGSATVTVVENITYYRDADNDGYGNAAITLISCNPSEPGYVTNNTDCNDNVASIHPGAPEVCFNNIDDDCDGSKYNGCSPALTNILPSYCGSTLTNAKSTIGATAATYSGPYTVTYLFRITNLSATPQVTVDLPRAFRNFNLGMTNIIAYGSTYSVMVAAVVNGEQQPFSAPCLITTPSIPTSKLIQCGATATSMTSSIGCNSVSYALAYQFEIAQTSNPGVVKVIERQYNNFSMMMITSAPNALPLLYDTDYTVRVKVKVLIDGEEIWGNYGNPCTVRTPLAPEAFMVNCDETGITPASLSTVLYANTINNATMYRFTLINEELGYNQFVEHAFNSFKLSDFNALSSLTSGETYSVIVDAMLFGNYYPGKDCQILVPLPAKAAMFNTAMPFEAKAYPNPFAENFKIDVKTNNNSAIDIKVYDMVGRLVESRKVNVSEMETTTIGDRYPSGVFNVVITQGDEVKTLRVVKR